MKQQTKLTNFFDQYLKRTSLFSDKIFLQTRHIPEQILHRDEQIEQLGHIFGPALRNEKPSNVFIYGKTGVGKTVTVRKLLEQDLMNTASKRNTKLTTLYVNCKLKKVADTEYRLLAHIVSKLVGDVPRGLHTEEISNLFVKSIEHKGIFILILDELDYLLKRAGDNVLYLFSRINEELKGTQLVLVGISNLFSLTENIDPRVRSSLSEEEILFHPYNAKQLQDILSKRAKKAFKQQVCSLEVIQKCAGYAANEHGDARKALDLLRVSGEIAERNNQKKVTTANVDEAEEKIEKNRVFEMIISQPQQVQLAFYTILKISKQKKGMLFTGEVYELYKQLCNHFSFRPLTQRRMSDILAELDESGFINARIISKGRYGRMREITLCVPPSLIKKIEKSLEEALGITA